MRNKADRQGCIHHKRDAADFNLFIGNFSLIELNGSNYSFTWQGPNNKRSKLDRVIVNDLWMRLGKWTVTGWNRRNSDHIPVQLHSDLLNWGPKPFKAFDNWLKDGLVTTILSQVNEECPNRHWFGFMKEVEPELKKWSQKNSNDRGMKIKQLENLMKHLNDNSNC